MSKNNEGPLIRYDPDHEPEDYTLRDDESAWITVGDLSVWIRDTGQGARIEVYPHFHEAELDPIGQLWVSQAEANVAVTELTKGGA